MALILSAAADALGPADFPHPVGRVVLIVSGVLLLPLGAFLWLGRIGLRELAAGNALTAVGLSLWRIFDNGFSAAGTTALVCTAAALAALAAAQVVTLRS